MEKFRVARDGKANRILIWFFAPLTLCVAPNFCRLFAVPLLLLFFAILFRRGHNYEGEERTAGASPYAYTSKKEQVEKRMSLNCHYRLYSIHTTVWS